MTPLEIVWRPSVVVGHRQYYKKFGRYICPRCSKEFWMNPSVADWQNSCGCGAGSGPRKHGLRNHPLYHVWVSMRQRCYLTTDTAYHRYGGRGINVCSEWHEFKPFYDWCMDNGWKPELNIERNDNDGNYEPNNCRFATDYEQAHNRCTNVINKEGVIALRARALTGIPIKELAKEFGIKHHTAWEIIANKKWKKL